jgi:hypothetical protein
MKGKKKDTYGIVANAAWGLSLIGTLYYLGRVLFYGGQRTPFIGMAVLCWVLYCLRPEALKEMEKFDEWAD